MKTIPALKQKAYYEITGLPSAPQIFPFVFDVTHEFIYNSDYFKLSSFGGKAVIINQKRASANTLVGIG